VHAVVAQRAVGDRLGDRVRLLVDLLEHERLEAALLGGLVVPLDLVDLARDLGPVGLEERRALRRDHHDLAVLDVLHAARLAQERRDRRGQERLAVAAADHERALLARPDERVGLVAAHRDEREVPVELGVGRAHGLGQGAGGEVVGDQVGDDLGVGLAAEHRAHVDETLLERHVVLDDPVDDDVDAARRVEVRVRVRLVHAPVGGPARVADPRGRGARGERDRAVARGGVASGGDGLAQVVEVSDRAHRLDRVAGDHRDPGRVVSAVLEPREPHQEQVLHGPLADISDDAAHDRRSSLWENDSEPRTAAPVGRPP
jgi:hypothetical protein